MALSTKRLALLHQIAEKKEQDAQRQLADAQKKLGEKQHMQRELEQYLGEYERQTTAVTTTAMLINQRQFVDRLHKAVVAQSQAVVAAERRMQAVRGDWLEQRKALQIAETMLEQGRVHEAKVSEKKLQREMDEFATTRFRPTAQA